jgi:tetratricopeptide (TPR) repeat protein
MFRTHPFVGGGLGEFYPRHVQLRPLGAEPTRMPHNMLLGLLGQAGLPAGLAALACLLIPAWLAFSPRDEEDGSGWLERVAIIVGVGAWSAHALVDLNVQVPGTLITAACLPLLALRERPAETVAESRVWWQRLAGSAQLLLVGIALAGVWRLPGARAFQQFDTAMQNRQPLPVLWEDGRRAARLLPTSPSPDRLLGNIAEATGNPQAAVEAYQDAVSRAPHRAALWDRLARARLEAGDRIGAGAAIAVAVEWNPGFPRYRGHAALIRGLRTDEKPPFPAEDLIKTGMRASYALDRKASTDAMVVLVSWPPDQPPPPVPLARFVAWLAPHAGTLGPRKLPVRFQ